MFMNYAQYVIATGKKDSRQAWIDWKTEICGMDQGEAIKASYDPDWGYEPLPYLNLK